jgi:signal peptidase
VNVLALVVLVAVVAPFVVYSMPAVVGADHSFVVLSGSMEPEISPGDVVIVGDATPDQIERGDVVTFQQADAEVPTTHRVVDVTQREDGVAYTTKGDANEDADPQPVRHSQVIGEVTYVIPLIGYVVRFANTQTGFLLLIGLPLGLLVANEAWSILRAGGSDTATDAGSETPPADSAAQNAAVTAAEPTATADASAAETASAGPHESDAESPSTYTVTRVDLRLSMAILSVFAVYATWVALQDTSGVTVTAAVGAGAGTVICGAIYYAAGGESEGSSPPTDSGGGDGDGNDDSGQSPGEGSDGSQSPAGAGESEEGETLAGDSDGGAGDRVPGTASPAADSSAPDESIGGGPPSVGAGSSQSSEPGGPEWSTTGADDTTTSHEAATNESGAGGTADGAGGEVDPTSTETDESTDRGENR